MQRRKRILYGTLFVIWFVLVVAWFGKVLLNLPILIRSLLPYLVYLLGILVSFLRTTNKGEFTKLYWTPWVLTLTMVVYVWGVVQQFSMWSILIYFLYAAAVILITDRFFRKYIGPYL